DPPAAGVYPLALHDALPISRPAGRPAPVGAAGGRARRPGGRGHPGADPPGAVVRPAADPPGRAARRVRRPDRTGAERGGVSPGVDRKSTRLNSSHVKISYAV